MDIAPFVGVEPAAAPSPRLRGWLHAAAAPVALAAGLLLTVAAAHAAAALAAYTAAATAVFTTSAVYHRGRWSPSARAVVGRLDHAMIFIIIAASYTPVAVAVLPGDSARALLLVVWTGAAAGVVFRVVWFTAPRWLYTPLYLVLGWSILPFLGEFLAAAPAGVLLMGLSGACYTVGAVVYGLRRPDPLPAWFGFHEVFHALTIGGWALHYGATWLIVTA